MIDLSTHYLGLKLKNPLVVSAGPLCREISNLKRMEESNASAIVLHSLFEEQIEIENNDLDLAMLYSSDLSAEAQNFYPGGVVSSRSGDDYLEHLHKAKQAVRIPVIGSLNGFTSGGWTRYAKLIEETGADALELNIYLLPSDPTVSGSEIEEKYLSLIREVKSSVKIPVAVKLGPYFSSMANMAVKLEKAGAGALVMFNRFYQPDYDLEAVNVIPQLTLSRSSELLLRLHWAAVLFGVIKTDMAITGGVHVVEDVVKSVMSGAKVTMLTSALLEQGIGYIETLKQQLEQWLNAHEYESIDQMRGCLARKSISNPEVYERINYMKVLHSYSLSTK